MSAVGVFDSGLGGLSAVRALRALLPREDIVYFGDAARVPYGTRSAETIRRFAAQDAAFLRSKGVKAILVACGTVSAAAMDVVQAAGLPALGVVEPAARAAAAQTKSKRIGVLGTPAAIASGAYARMILALDPAAEVCEVPCPLLVSIVESGAGGEIARLAVREYLKEPLEAGADTLLLGCTHYPLLSDVFREEAPGLTLIDAGAEAARQMAQCLASRGLLEDDGGNLTLYTSDFSQNFAALSARFLGELTSFVEEKVAIETWEK